MYCNIQKNYITVSLASLNLTKCRPHLLQQIFLLPVMLFTYIQIIIHFFFHLIFEPQAWFFFSSLPYRNHLRHLHQHATSYHTFCGQHACACVMSLPAFDPFSLLTLTFFCKLLTLTTTKATSNTSPRATKKKKKNI